MISMAPIRHRQRGTGFLCILCDLASIIGTLYLIKSLSLGWFDQQAVIAALVACLGYLVPGQATGLLWNRQ